MNAGITEAEAGHGANLSEAQLAKAMQDSEERILKAGISKEDMAQEFEAIKDILARVEVKVGMVQNAVEAGFEHVIGQLADMDKRLVAGSGAPESSADVAKRIELLLKRKALQNSTVVIPSLKREAKVHLDAVYTELLHIDHDELIVTGADEYENIKAKKKKRLENGAKDIQLREDGAAK